MELTNDKFLDGKILVKQPKIGYRAAMDPVLMAAAVPEISNGKILDLGAGVGVAALCYGARVPDVEIIGLELQKDYAELAIKNAKLNFLDDRIKIIHGDLLNICDINSNSSDFATGSFQQIMANPPFLAANKAISSPVSAKNIANMEGNANLSHWIDFILKMLKPKGGLTIIHRADRIDEILSLLYGRAGDVTIIPLFPFAGRDAKRVIIRAQKSTNGVAKLTAGLILHAENNRYTKQTDNILRHNAGLFIS